MIFFEKFLTTILKCMGPLSFIFSLYNFRWGKKQLKEQKRSYLSYKINAKECDDIYNKIYYISIVNTGSVRALNVEFLNLKIDKDPINLKDPEKKITIDPGDEVELWKKSFDSDSFEYNGEIEYSLPVSFVLKHRDIYNKKFYQKAYEKHCNVFFKFESRCILS